MSTVWAVFSRSAVCAFEPLAAGQDTALPTINGQNKPAGSASQSPLQLASASICNPSYSLQTATARMTVYDEEEADFWTTVNKFSRNPDRPKRNSKFLVFLVLVGCVGVVVFAVLAVLTMNTRNTSGCPCANPYKILGNGEKILDPEQCFKDMTYVACYDEKTRKHALYAGLAGGSGGLLVLSLLLFRYG